MKKILLATVAVVTVATSASASNWATTSTGWANFGGGNGTVINADIGQTGAGSAGDSSTVTQTAPPLVVSDANLTQETGGDGASVNNLNGQLGQAGQTGAGANGEVTWSATNGSAQMIGGAAGDNSIVLGTMDAGSDQGSLAVDTPFGGGNASFAEQVVNVGVIAAAGSAGFGSQAAGTGASGNVNSTSGAGGN